MQNRGVGVESEQDHLETEIRHRHQECDRQAPRGDDDVGAQFEGKPVHEGRDVDVLPVPDQDDGAYEHQPDQRPDAELFRPAQRGIDDVAEEHLKDHGDGDDADQRDGQPLHHAIEDLQHCLEGVGNNLQPAHAGFDDIDDAVHVGHRETVLPLVAVSFRNGHERPAETGNRVVELGDLLGVLDHGGAGHLTFGRALGPEGGRGRSPRLDLDDPLDKERVDLAGDVACLCHEVRSHDIFRERGTASGETRLDGFQMIGEKKERDASQEHQRKDNAKNRIGINWLAVRCLEGGKSRPYRTLIASWDKGLAKSSRTSHTFSPTAISPSIRSGDQTASKPRRQRTRRGSGPGQRSQHACDIRPRKIRPDIEQGTVPCLGNFIGEAVAEVQPGRMGAFTPSRVGIGYPPGHGRRDACNLELESIDKPGHFRAEAPPFGNDQRFGYRRGGDHDPLVCRERLRTGRRLGCVQQDRHQCRGVDRDHFGRPSPS